jgi:predicted amidohydrolase
MTTPTPAALSAAAGTGAPSLSSWSSVRVSVWQGLAVAGDVSANLSQLHSAVQRAAADGSQLVLFPELFLTGYCIGKQRLQDLSLALDSPALQQIAAWAKQYRIAICPAYPERVAITDDDAVDGAATNGPAAKRAKKSKKGKAAAAADEPESKTEAAAAAVSKAPAYRYYISVSCFDATGARVAHYRKTHLWACIEKDVFSAGNGRDDGHSLAVFDLTMPAPEGSSAPAATVRCGFLICFDVEVCPHSLCCAACGRVLTPMADPPVPRAVLCRCVAVFAVQFPEPARVLFMQGVELLLVPTALAQGPCAMCIPKCVVPTRATENLCFVAYSNFARLERSGRDTSRDQKADGFGGNANLTEANADGDATMKPALSASASASASASSGESKVRAVQPLSSPSSALSEYEGRIVYCGGSAIVAPAGNDLARASSAPVPSADAGRAAELLTADLRAAVRDDDASRNPYRADRRPEMYSALTAVPVADKANGGGDGGGRDRGKRKAAK